MTICAVLAWGTSRQMGQILSDFLAKRQYEVRSEMELTLLDIAEHEMRLVGLRARQRGLEAEMAALELAAGLPATAPRPKRLSIKEQILAVLRVCPEPLTAQDVFEAVRLSNPALQRTSFSPQLSRLCRQGRVVMTLDHRYHCPPTESRTERT